MMLTSLAPQVATPIFAFAMVYAGLMDLTTMRIRNGLCLGLLAAYAALAPFASLTVEEVAWSAALAGGLLVASFVMFAFGWMGGGDGKLLAVTALWLGVDQAPTFLVYIGLFGGALTLAILQLRLVGLPAFLGNRPWIARLQSDKSGVPYGVAITLAALIVFPQTRWFAL
ncbi:MAG: peptidase [Rhodospirillales bacterium]|nr:peptidase [Rhodospirillales bacterium]